MNIGQYILRAIKHFVKMMVLIVGIYALMSATDTLGITQEELFGTKGIVLIVALVVLSAAYPSYGFVTRSIRGSLSLNREAILRAFNHNGYTLRSESENEWIFRASGPLKRLIHLGDDSVTLRRVDDNHFEISGIRKEVVQVEFRISGNMLEQ